MKRAKPEYSANFPYLLKLLSCVLNDTMPPKPNADTDWASVFYMAQCHSVAGMVYYALLKMESEDKPSEDILNKFREAYTLDLLKETNVSFEAEALLKLFREKGIETVPVKGFCIKKDYPESAMRTMTDIDLLCKREDIPSVLSIFERRGYSVRNYNLEELDATLEPFHHYEVHSVLIKNYHTYGGYFDDFFYRSKAENGCDYLSLSPDDSYIYLLAHLAKHLESGGAGIRMIMDVYVFNKKHKAELNDDYLRVELEKIRLHKFRNVVESLANNWFSGEEPKTDTLVADYILCCCTFGTGKNAVLANALSYEKETGKKQTGTKRVLRSIFPSVKDMSKKYHKLAKFRILYPFYWCRYWFERIFKYRNLNKDNLKNYYRSTDSEDGRKVAAMLKDMGLEER